MSTRTRVNWSAKVSGVLAGLGVATMLLAPVATAAPSGSSTMGCRAQIFTTAFSTECVDTKASGDFRTTAMCDYQPTVSGAWQWVGKGSNVKGVSAGQCSIGVKSAQTTYRG